MNLKFQQPNLDAVYSGPRLGVIGGMGSRAGVNFLHKIVQYSPADGDQQFIEIFYHNNSLIPDRTEALINKKTSPVNELVRSIKILNQQNVDVIVAACITAYLYYPQFKVFTGAHIIHPLDVAAKALAGPLNTCKKIGVLATTGTIKSGLFDPLFDQLGLSMICLDDWHQENVLMKAIYMKGGLKSATISAQARELLYTSIPMLMDLGADALLVACTELPLALSQECTPVPLIDVIDLMAKETVLQCYKPSLSHD